MPGHADLPILNGKKLKIGIVRALWHDDMTSALTEQAVEGLRDCGVIEKNILVVDVPGSFEVVYGAAKLIEEKHCDAVIAIGVLLKGDTMHFEYIAEAVSHGLMRLNVETTVPVIFGILTCLNEKQARERSLGKKSHGYNWGLSAVQMGVLKQAR